MHACRSTLEDPTGEGEGEGECRKPVCYWEAHTGDWDEEVADGVLCWSVGTGDVTHLEAFEDTETLWSDLAREFVAVKLNHPCLEWDSTVGGAMVDAHGILNDCVVDGGETDDAEDLLLILAEYNNAGGEGTCETCEADTDEDGICDDVDNCPAVSNSGQTDTDEDGLGDACEPTCEGTDTDDDGVCDDVDNCLYADNSNQADADADGLGDPCDPCAGDTINDPDSDALCAFEDNCPLVYNVDQTDEDTDDIGDACDPCLDDIVNDPDGDHVCANFDNCPTVWNRDQRDLDADSDGDECDSDADADGSNDTVDCNDLDPSVNPGADEIPENSIDDDCDGVDDVTETLPPDPVAIATAVDRTVPTDIFDSTRFLYEADPPVQAGVVEDAISPFRVNVVRGHVRVRGDDPLSNVVVTVKGHPELGHTKTRTDGSYDLAVNGGGTLTLRFTHAGYLEAQRSITPLVRDWTIVDDVALVPLGDVNELESGAEELQIARGDEETDDDGTRQATLIVKPGTLFTAIRPGAKEVELSTLSLRLTEYTVGDDGPAAMPASLPTTSAYTYAVDISIDEATAVGADHVSLDVPVPLYVENFLEAPVGSAIPLGYYDRGRAAWVEEQDGLVLKVLDIDGDLAVLDVDGDDEADSTETLSGLGIDDEERAALASLYEPDQTLWRFALAHFSIVDGNCGGKLPPKKPVKDEPPEEVVGCHAGGSIIDLENRVLEEDLPIVGTSMSLVYRSDRVPGNKYLYTVKANAEWVSTPPEGLINIDLFVDVAGQRLEATDLTPNGSQGHTFVWDGRDGYNRLVQGKQTARITKEYAWDVEYLLARPATFPWSFANYPVPGTDWRTMRQYRLDRATSTAELGAWMSDSGGLGGVTLNVEHGYDASRRTLYTGDGTVRGGLRSVSDGVLNTVAGVGSAPCDPFGDACGDGASALDASLPYLPGLAVMSDGSILLAGGSSGGPFGGRVRRIDPSGVIHAFAGMNEGYSGDGGLAVDADVCASVVAVGPDDVVYIAGRCSGGSVGIFPVIRKITPDGVITTVAGLGTEGSCVQGEGGAGYGLCGDGGAALDATFDNITALAPTDDGAVYVAAQRVRKLTTGGRIVPVLGSAHPEDNTPADDVVDGAFGPEISLKNVNALAAGHDGRVFAAIVGDENVQSTVALEPDGTVTVLASPTTLTSLAVANDGSLVVASNAGVARMALDGTATDAQWQGTKGADGVFTSGESYVSGAHIAILPDGAPLVEGGSAGSQLFALSFPFPAFALDDAVIPSRDGSELYVFNAAGRHLRTVDARTGGVKLLFDRDEAGLLSSVTDMNGLVTTFERDEAGVLTGIIGPFEDRTDVSIGEDGYLDDLSDALERTTHLDTSEDGLLNELVDTRSGSHVFSYTAQGRLLSDEDPAGGSTSLDVDGDDLVRTSGEAIERRYSQDHVYANPHHHTVTHADGLVSESVRDRAGHTTVTTPDGTVTETTVAPDPQLGAAAAYPARTVTTLPSTIARVVEQVREKDVETDGTLITETVTTSLNEKDTVSVFTLDTNTLTTTSPEGRTTTIVRDELDRPSDIAHSGLASVHIEYDEFGHPESIVQGTGPSARTTTLGYGEDGRLETITTALGTTTLGDRDAVGRVRDVERIDGEHTTFTFDEADNMMSLTPPEKPTHAMTYTPVNLLETVTAPAVDSIPRVTTYAYNLDRQLESITRPSTDVIGFDYDEAGRLETTTFSAGTLVRGYSETTGQLETITGVDDEDLAFVYDGPILTSTIWDGPVEGSVTMTPNADFLPDEQEVNSSFTVSFGYDNDLLLTAAGDLTVDRDPDTGLIEGTDIDLVTTTETHTTFGELESYAVEADATGVLAIDYHHDEAGRIDEKTETRGGTVVTEYHYDEANRLEEVIEDSVTVLEMHYDENGNRDSITDGSGTTTCDYDNQDRLISCGDVDYDYDDDGSLISREDTFLTETTTYAYDSFGNLRHVVLPDTTEIDYVIDGLNRRVGKMVDSTLVQGFLYDGQLRVVAELDGENEVVSRFVYATHTNVPDLVIKGEDTYRVVHDQLGSPLMVINVATGDIAQERSYDAWGKSTDSNPGFMPFGFAGGLEDLDTGLVRFGARDYDPETGRWTAKDPISFDGGDTNLYGYVLGDPVNHNDPRGLWDDVGVGMNWMDESGWNSTPEGAWDVYVDATGTSYEIAHDDFGQPLPENGLDPCTISNALRHCMGSCGFAREGGSTWVLGQIGMWVHEWFQTGQDTLLDQQNNICGEEIANSGEACVEGCIDYYFADYLAVAPNGSCQF